MEVYIFCFQLKTKYTYKINGKLLIQSEDRREDTWYHVWRMKLNKLVSLKNNF